MARQRSYPALDAGQWVRIRNPQGERGRKDYMLNRSTGETLGRRQYLNRQRGHSVERHLYEPKPPRAPKAPKTPKTPKTSSQPRPRRTSGGGQGEQSRPGPLSPGQESAAWRDFVSHYQSTHGGKSPEGTPETNAEYQRIVQDLQAPRSKSPHGRKANALVKLGRRRRGDTWPVGETPK